MGWINQGMFSKKGLSVYLFEPYLSQIMKVNSVHEGKLTFSLNDLVTVCHTYIRKVSIAW
jgi:hypothetical protein